MNDNNVIEKVRNQVKLEMSGESTGHDWWHVYRVWRNARAISKIEGGNHLIIELATLLHDIKDWKFSNDEQASSRYARQLLSKLNMNNNDIEHVCQIIDNVSYKGAGVENKIHTLEGKIVQDADRLDALGAIGIARAFAYGGHKGREMHNPDSKPLIAKNFDEYKSSGETTVNHFYEKLLLLKDMMNTKTGKEMAEKRHVFMETYLKQFNNEWEGKQ